MALPMMSETNAERNNQVLDALQEQKEMMMNNSQEQEQAQPKVRQADLEGEEEGEPMNIDDRDPDDPRLSDTNVVEEDETLFDRQVVSQPDIFEKSVRAKPKKPLMPLPTPPSREISEDNKQAVNNSSLQPDAPMPEDLQTMTEAEAKAARRK